MRQRVTAILVARSGAAYLSRTLSALASQTRAPDSVIAVDLESQDASAALLSASTVTVLITAPARTSFGQGVAHAVTIARNAQGAEAQDAETAPPDSEWLWLLAHDNAPQPDALERLLGAVEIAPSVAIAGPKLMIWDKPRVIAEFGETITRFGGSLALVDHELDQAQHDVQNDVLGVAATGMLVRRSVWMALGGFDRGLPSTDAALDFCIRARLAGHRVITVPTARVAIADVAVDSGRSVRSAGRARRTRRAAQLHRRLVYTPIFALPLHWLALVPLAFARSILHLLTKRPGYIGAEFLAAFAVAFADTSIFAARRRLRRTRTTGFRAIAPLRLSARRAWEYRAQRHEKAEAPTPTAVADDRVGFIAGGGLWAVGGAAAIGMLAFGQLIGAASVTGGGVLPLSPTLTALWANTGWGHRGVGTGLTAAADPFAYLLAVLGSVTFWQPSLSIVVLYLVALPLAALGAWFCARRFTVRPWVPALAAFLWAIAPPFLAGLQAGHLGAVVAHLLLPWLILLAVNSVRSWSSAAGSGLIFAAVVAGAPILALPLLLLWLVWLLAQPRSWLRLIGMPIPAGALFFPLIIDQWLRSNPLGLLADPGATVAKAVSSGLQLALGSAAGGSNGWTALLPALGLPAAVAPVIVAVLLLPLGFLAVAALFTRGSVRAIMPLAIGLIGFLTAAASSRIFVSSVGESVTAIWAGAGLSLFWFGLVGSAIVALDSIDRVAHGSGVLLGVATTFAAVPLISAALIGTTVVQPGTGRTLPAIVVAQTATQPQTGTLVLRPTAPDALTATLERGTGTTLDDLSTIPATAPGLSTADRRLATLAGNLVSRSGYDSTAELTRLSISFVLLANPDRAADTRDSEIASVTQRIRQNLDGNERFVAVGQTSGGLLWRFTERPVAPVPGGVGNRDTPYGLMVLAIQALVFAVTAILAIPTGRSVRRRRRPDDRPSGPATTFDEETDD